MKTLLIAFALFLMVLGSCSDPLPHVLIADDDSTKTVSGGYSKRDNYEGEVPGMDAKVIDYTLPNPYQHIPQILFDSTVATSWDKAGFPDAKRFIIFFKDFQLDVQDRNKEKIAGLIQFPLRNYKTKSEFLKNFDSIFMPDFVHDVLYQDPLEIYRDEKGAMIGNGGQLWFRQINGKYKIVAINP